VSSADQSQHIRPSAGWYLVVAAAWVGAVVCVVFAFKPLFDVLDITPTPVDNHGSVTVSDEGLTVYTSSSARAVVCRLLDGRGRPYALQRVSDTGTVEVNGLAGSPMYPVATTPDGFAPGTYTLECVGAGESALGYGDRVDWEGVVVQLGLLFILAGFLGVGGLVVLIVLLVRRHNSKERLRWAQAAYAGWGQWYGYGSAYPYGSAPGSYPPGGSPQTGYPTGGYPPTGDPGGSPQPGYPPPDYTQSGWSSGHPQSGWPPEAGDEAASAGETGPTDGDSGSDRPPDDGR
jgi:hypothetical protein